MKEKINNWLDKPITWRDSFRAGCWSMVITIVIYAIAIAYIYIDDIKDFFEEVIDKIKAKLGLNKTNSKDSSEFDV